VDTISEKDTQSADDKKKEKISYIEAIILMSFPEDVYLQNLHRQSVIKEPSFQVSSDFTDISCRICRFF